MLKIFEHLKNKELLLALYFFIFIFGYLIRISDNFYNELRILEILMLLIIYVVWGGKTKLNYIRVDILFFLFLIIGGFFWNNAEFIILDLLVFYLLFKVFFILDYNEIYIKIIIISSFSIFILLPFSIYSYINTGVYENWYPMPWNIRIYNSFFLIFSIFAIWFYLNNEKLKNFYLLFTSLAFLSILLDGGRSATIAYTVFLALVCIFNKLNRFKLILVYTFTWMVYFLIIFLSPSNPLRPIIRDTSSGRYNLWEHAILCWLNNPIFGCGFYQLDRYVNLPAHPHNLFIQILSETGLIGFAFLSYLIYSIFININIKQKNGYFLLASFVAIGIELSLSGVYVYPVTQISLLLLFVFLLKNSEFNEIIFVENIKTNKIDNFINFILGLLLLILFSYLFFNYFRSDLFGIPLSPPRFWEYGYKLFVSKLF
ncbi:O-antigen ligase family protein [Acinetobacter sp. GXMZU3951]